MSAAEGSNDHHAPWRAAPRHPKHFQPFFREGSAHSAAVPPQGVAAVHLPLLRDRLPFRNLQKAFIIVLGLPTDRNNAPCDIDTKG